MSAPASILICALAVASAAPVLFAQRLRVGVDLVHFGVAVADRRGEPLTGLTIDDFEVLERGKPQEIKFFATGTGEEDALPLHLGFLLDASGSMDQDIRDVRTAAIKFLNQTDQAVDVTLVDFDTEVRVARYGAHAFPSLIERIRMRKPGGMTAFYDALGVYLRAASEQTGQKVLVVYTDGGDTRSTINAGDVAELLKASDVTMYALGYLQNAGASARTHAQGELTRFATATGGQAFFPTSLKELDSLYEKIQKEVAGRYTLGYISSDDRKDGTWRPVEIKLKRNDLRGVKVRTRPGYYAPGTPAGR